MRFRITLALTLAAALLPLTAQTSADFQFIHIRSKREMMEIASVIHGMSDCHAASVDAPSATLNVQGNADQIALSGWLFKQLDQPPGLEPPQTLTSSALQFALPGGDNVVRLFYLPYTPNSKDFQEVVTAVRSTADIRRMFTEDAQRAVAARGTADEMALAAWMFDQLGNPQVEKSSSAMYHIPSGNLPWPKSHLDTAQVLHVPGTQSVEDFQEEVTLLRTVADIRLLFSYRRPREIVARGAAGQITLLEWLLPRLDASSAARNSDRFQITDQDADAERVVEVFYLPQSLSVAEFQQKVDAVRKSAGIRRVLTYNAPRIVVVRGNLAQVETAERLVNASTSPLTATANSFGAIPF